MSICLLWLSKNALRYRRVINANLVGTATTTAARFLHQLKSEKFGCAVIQLPIANEELAPIAKAWSQLPAPPPVLVFDPDQSLGAGEFPASWPSTWLVLRNGDEQVVRDAIHSIAVPAPIAASETWRSMLVGTSNAMSEIRELIDMVANLNATVMISGSTGTGKEVAARAIHLASKRAGKPFVAVNCAALPDSLLEAELFGHTKGAFTGATNARVGLFEQAHGGTIFLDEIGDMPMELQAKLLRVVQERKIQRLGSSELTPIDVRIITATNADLRELCLVKRFRQDLYFRLNVVPIRMPLLKDRPEDIVLLLNHFLAKVAKQENLPLKQIDQYAYARLMAYSWMGNVRELEHSVERAMAISGTRTLLRIEDFCLEETGLSDFAGIAEFEMPESGFDFELASQQFQIAMLDRAMRKACGNKQRAANLLGLKRTTMLSKFKALEYTT